MNSQLQVLESIIINQTILPSKILQIQLGVRKKILETKQIWQKQFIDIVEVCMIQLLNQFLNTANHLDVKQNEEKVDVLFHFEAQIEKATNNMSKELENLKQKFMKQIKDNQDQFPNFTANSESFKIEPFYKQKPKNRSLSSTLKHRSFSNSIFRQNRTQKFQILKQTSKDNELKNQAIAKNGLKKNKKNNNYFKEVQKYLNNTQSPSNYMLDYLAHQQRKIHQNNQKQQIKRQERRHQNKQFHPENFQIRNNKQNIIKLEKHQTYFETPDANFLKNLQIKMTTKLDEWMQKNSFEASLIAKKQKQDTKKIQLQTSKNSQILMQQVKKNNQIQDQTVSPQMFKKKQTNQQKLKNGKKLIKMTKNKTIESQSNQADQINLKKQKTQKQNLIISKKIEMETIVLQFRKVSSKIILPITKSLLTLFKQKIFEFYDKNKLNIAKEIEAIEGTEIIQNIQNFLMDSLGKMQKMLKLKCDQEKKTKILSYINICLKCLESLYSQNLAAPKKEEKIEQQCLRAKLEEISKILFPNQA